LTGVKTKVGHGEAVCVAVSKWGEVFGTSRRVGKSRPAGLSLADFRGFRFVGYCLSSRLEEADLSLRYLAF